MKVERLRFLLYQIGLVAVIIVGWQGYVLEFNVPSYILPAPTAIGLALWTDSQILLANMLVTLYEVSLGFALGASVGIISAMALLFSKFLRSTFYALTVAIQAIPKSAMAPTIVLWLGIGIYSKIGMVVLITYFPVFAYAIVGMTAIDPELIELLDSMAATESQVFVKLRLPHSLYYIIQGFKIALPYSMVGAIVAEFVASQAGIGNLILIASSILDGPRVFAAMVLVSTTSLILYWALAFIEAKVVRWAPIRQTLLAGA